MPDRRRPGVPTTDHDITLPDHLRTEDFALKVANHVMHQALSFRRTASGRAEHARFNLLLTVEWDASKRLHLELWCPDEGFVGAFAREATELEEGNWGSARRLSILYWDRIDVARMGRLLPYRAAVSTRGTLLSLVLDEPLELQVRPTTSGILCAFGFAANDRRIAVEARSVAEIDADTRTVLASLALTRGGLTDLEVLNHLRPDSNDPERWELIRA